MSHTISKLVPIFKQAYLKSILEKTEIVVPFIDGNVIVSYFATGGSSPETAKEIYNVYYCNSFPIAKIVLPYRKYLKISRIRPKIIIQPEMIRINQNNTKFIENIKLLIEILKKATNLPVITRWRIVSKLLNVPLEEQ